MKYSLACNWDPALLERLREETPSVDTLFGQITDDPFGGGRGSFLAPKCGRAQAADYIASARKLGLHFNYLLNGACQDNLELTFERNRVLFEHIEWAASTGADKVTVSLPIVLTWLKRHFPQLKVSVSSWAQVANVKRAKYWEDLGADEIILGEYATRDFAALRGIRRAVKCRLELLANTSCLYMCHLGNAHINLMSHSAQGGHVSGGYAVDHCQGACQRIKLTRPEELMKARWVRPEDVRDYDELGIDSFKLLERFRTTESLKKVALAYEKRRFDGNLAELLTLPSRDAFKPPNMEYLVRPGLADPDLTLKLANIFSRSFSDVIHIDNRALEGFAAHFMMHDCYHASCEDCGHCARWTAKAVQVDEKKRAAILAGFDEFAEAVAAPTAARGAARSGGADACAPAAGVRELLVGLWCMLSLAPPLVKKALRLRIVSLMVSLVPLAVFLQVARYYGSTPDAWRLAFLWGAASSAAVIAAYMFRRRPFRDMLAALALMCFAGSAAFLSGFAPLLSVFARFQGSVFLACYLLVRAALYFAPAALSGVVYDPYRAIRLRAAFLSAAIFAWSLFFRDVTVSTTVPTALMLLLLSPHEAAPAVKRP